MQIILMISYTTKNKYRKIFIKEIKNPKRFFRLQYGAKTSRLITYVLQLRLLCTTHAKDKENKYSFFQNHYYDDQYKKSEKKSRGFFLIYEQER